MENRNKKPIKIKDNMGRASGLLLLFVYCFILLFAALLTLSDMHYQYYMQPLASIYICVAAFLILPCSSLLIFRGHSIGKRFWMVLGIGTLIVSALAGAVSMIGAQQQKDLYGWGGFGVGFLAGLLELIYNYKGHVALVYANLYNHKLEKGIFEAEARQKEAQRLREQDIRVAEETKRMDERIRKQGFTDMDTIGRKVTADAGIPAPKAAAAPAPVPQKSFRKQKDAPAAQPPKADTEAPGRAAVLSDLVESLLRTTASAPASSKPAEPAAPEAPPQPEAAESEPAAEAPGGGARRIQ